MNPDGSSRAYFGYDNQNLVSLSIPHGPGNQLNFDSLGVRPTEFAPGSATFAAAVDIPVHQTAVWQLTPPNGWTTAVTASASSPACTAEQSVGVACADSCVTRQATECSSQPDFATCVEGCLDTAEFFSDCLVELTGLLNCEATSAPETWICDPDFGPFPTACGADEEALFACLFGS